MLNLTSFSANFLTFSALVIGIGGTLGLYLDAPLITIISFYVSYCLDFSDGKVARLRGTASGFGKKLDIITDRLVFGFSIVGYVYFTGIQERPDALLQYVIFALLFLLGDVFQLSGVLGDYYDGKVFQKLSPRTDGAAGYWKGFLEWRRWVPKSLFLLFIAFVLIPSLNFPIELMIAMNIWAALLLLRVLWAIFGVFICTGKSSR